MARSICSSTRHFHQLTSSTPTPTPKNNTIMTTLKCNYSKKLGLPEHKYVLLARAPHGTIWSNDTAIRGCNSTEKEAEPPPTRHMHRQSRSQRRQLWWRFNFHACALSTVLSVCLMGFVRFTINLRSIDNRILRADHSARLENVSARCSHPNKS